MFRKRLLLYVTSLCLATNVGASFSINSTHAPAEGSWGDIGKIAGLLLKKCWLRASQTDPEDFFIVVHDCIKERILMAVDRTMQDNSISIIDGIELVRWDRNNSFYESGAENSWRNMKLAEESADWETQIIGKIVGVFGTHVLKVHLDSLDDKNNNSVDEARRRHRKNPVTSLLLFGVIAMALILVPMGFKFLAVLGGKALLLAKMALILSSIQGLKKVATSNLNYGLYHTPPHNPSVHDREWIRTHSGPSAGPYDNIPDQQLDLLRQSYSRM